MGERGLQGIATMPGLPVLPQLLDCQASAFDGALPGKEDRCRSLSSLVSVLLKPAWARQADLPALTSNEVLVRRSQSCIFPADPDLSPSV